MTTNEEDAGGRPMVEPAGNARAEDEPPSERELRASVERLVVALRRAGVTPEEARRLLEDGRLAARDGGPVAGLDSARWRTVREGARLRWHLVDAHGHVRAWIEHTGAEGEWRGGAGPGA